MDRAVMLLALVASGAQAQGAFVVVNTVRNDTLYVEHFTRSVTQLTGELLVKGQPRQVYTSTLLPDGRLGAMTLVAYPPGTGADAAPMVTAKVALDGDTAVATQEMNGRTAPAQRIPSRAVAQPIMNASIAQVQVMLDAVRRTKAATGMATVFLAQGGRTVDVSFANLTTDSVAANLGAVWWLKLDAQGRIVRGGVPAQNLLVTRVDAPASNRIWRTPPDYSPPAGAPYAAEPVRVTTSSGHALAGTFTKPIGVTGRVPVAISITGSGPQDRDEYISAIRGGYRLFRQLADTLGRRGIAMLRMDDRGVGESGGSFTGSTSRDFATDIRAAIAYLRTRSDVDSRRLFLIGHSEGGMIAPMVAVNEPQLAGIVLMAGTGRTGREIMAFQQSYALDHDTTLTPAKRTAAKAAFPATLDSAIAADPWLAFFATHDPVATAKRVKVPVLILQGADDQQVIAAEAPLLAKAFRDGGNRDVTLQVFPELNHFFIRQPGGAPSGYTTLPTNLASAEVLGVAADWIVRKASRGATQ
jgi:dienelactone hydrolase